MQRRQQEQLFQQNQPTYSVAQQQFNNQLISARNAFINTQNFQQSYPFPYMSTMPGSRAPQPDQMYSSNADILQQMADMKKELSALRIQKIETQKRLLAQYQQMQAMNMTREQERIRYLEQPQPYMPPIEQLVPYDPSHYQPMPYNPPAEVETKKQWKQKSVFKHFKQPPTYYIDRESDSQKRLNDKIIRESNNELLLQSEKQQFDEKDFKSWLKQKSYKNELTNEEIFKQNGLSARDFYLRKYYPTLYLEEQIAKQKQKNMEQQQLNKFASKSQYTQYTNRTQSANNTQPSSSTRQYNKLATSAHALAAFKDDNALNKEGKQALKQKQRQQQQDKQRLEKSRDKQYQQQQQDLIKKDNKQYLKKLQSKQITTDDDIMIVEQDNSDWEDT